jgi:sugar phosphate isomerase/epimerase
MTYKIGGATYGKLPFEPQVQNIIKTGFDFAEIDLTSPQEPNKKLDDELEKIKKSINICVAHLPEIDYSQKDVEKCKNFIEIFSRKGVHLFVFHFYTPKMKLEEKFDLKIGVLNELANFAKKHSSKLMFENTEESIELTKKIFERVPSLFFCLDIGHANLFGENKSITLIEIFGERLAHIHAHDNFGGLGNIDFHKIFSKLKEINYSGNITMEVYSQDLNYRKYSLQNLKRLIN